MDELDEMLAGVCRSTDGARVLAVVGRDGLVVGHGGGPDGDLPRLAAEAADLVSAAERTLGEPRGEGARELSIRGSRASLLVRGLGEEMFALWVLEADVDLAAAASAARDAAPRLREALE